MVGAAFFMDLILGDPKWFPHPVRAMGKASSFLEKMTRRFIQNEKLAGTITVLVMAITTYGVCYGLVQSAHNWNDQFGFAIEAALIYTSLATRSLYDESNPVLSQLRHKAILF